MDEAGTCEPNGAEHDGQLGETNGIACAQEIEVLEYVRHIHAAQDSKKTQADPMMVEVNANKCWWDREEVNDCINIQPEP